MKFVLRPQRRRATQAESRIALFPFLAVLICTMGALIPLLMAITSIAKRQAEAASAAKAAEQTADVRTRLEDARWRIELLRQSRQKTEAQLADSRLQLGHLEDHERRLREEFERHRKTLADFNRLDQTERRGSETEAELQRVRGEIDAAARRLAETRNQAAARKPSYAIIPYEGPNQTFRRPIYIECRADAVVLQPEGIELTDSDFDGPPGPGNPLAAAMRAAREYMLAQADFDAKAGEPYPLLLVRPEGINAYYAARAAMASWGSDFGYELIGDDWNLSFPPPDPRLAQVVRQVVASARMSQARLAAAAPTHRGVRSKVVYRAGSAGGFVREEAYSGTDEEDYRPVSPAGPVAAQKGEGRGAGGEESSLGNGIPGNALPPNADSNYAGNNSSPNDRPATGDTGNGYGNSPAAKGPATGDASYATKRIATGDASYATKRPATAVAGGGYGNSPGSPTSGDAADSNPLRGTEGWHDPEHSEGRVSPDSHALRSSGRATQNSSRAPDAAPYAVGSDSLPQNAFAGGGGNNTRPEGYVIGHPPREQAPSSQSADGATGRPLLPGQWEPPPEPPPGKPNVNQKDDPADKKGGGCPKTSSLAGKRGTDWGLRDASRGAVGIKRPIHIECHADRLVVFSDRDPSGNKVVPLGARVESSIDTLISAVWEQMESWGIAGRSMYWRPVLKVSVAPGGQRRFDELAALLEGSGLLVEKK